MVIELLIASWVAFAPPDGDETTNEADPTADLSKAQQLFDEGLARYDAADYEGAIEVFTLALSEVRGQGVSDFRVRGLLLFNIGRAHVRAHGIDHDVEHLRQAQSILRSFLEEANSEEFAGTIDADTLAEAEQQLAEIDRALAEPEPEAEPGPGPKPIETDSDPSSPQAKRHRAIGIGLTASGVAVLGAGVGMLVTGTLFVPKAQARIDAYEPTPSILSQGEVFLAQERRKGTAWMAGGAVAATLGVIGVAVGIQQLIKSSRANRPSVSAGVGPQGMGVVVQGRF
jgi:hypothetical protein